MPATEYYSSPDLWKYLGANLCFLNFIHPSLPGVFNRPIINDTSVNPALWTLKIEVGFYLILPLLMLWLKKAKRPWIVMLSIYILAVVYRIGFQTYGEQTHTNMYIILSRQLPGFMSYFVFGIAGYLYKDFFLRHKNILIIPAVLLFGMEYYLGLEILTPAVWGIIILWCAYSISALNNFARYGDISYGIYIYHGPILKTLLSIGCFSTIGVWPSALVYITCVILIGLISWHLLENRILKRK